MKAARVEMQEFRNTISSLTSAVSVCNSRIDDLNARVETIESRQHEQSAVCDVPILQQTIAELKLEHNDRVQDMLRNDIEIAGLPEESNERSIHLALTIASKLGVTLEERDIVSVERSGAPRPAGPDKTVRPRPLVVKLARRVHRDQLLEAARVRRSTTTAGMGLASPDSRIYVNERLTQSNRQIFYKARHASLTAHWKFRLYQRWKDLCA